jgi:hypothetical protein
MMTMTARMNTATKRRRMMMMRGCLGISETVSQEHGVKCDVQTWVTDSDWCKLRYEHTEETHAVYTASRFKLADSEIITEDMTTLRLAMLYAFNKSKSGRAADAMETVRTLLTECGVKPSETEKQAELLDFIAFKLPSVFPDAKEDCGARLLSMVLDEESAFVGDDESAMNAVALLASSGNDGMMSKLLLARRDLLSQASVFESITQAMVYGTEAMVLNSHLILEAKIGRTTHHATGSTLLHFAVKRDAGRYVATMVKYCDVSQKDNKGRTAAECLPLLGASEERTEELRALLLLSASQ